MISSLNSEATHLLDDSPIKLFTTPIAIGTPIKQLNNNEKNIDNQHLRNLAHHRRGSATRAVERALVH